MPKADHDYISTTEAGEILGISRQRVLKLVQQGRLKSIKVANVYLIKKSDLVDVKDRKPGRPRSVNKITRTTAKKKSW